jgi:hypothetical protein
MINLESLLDSSVFWIGIFFLAVAFGNFVIMPILNGEPREKKKKK